MESLDSFSLIFGRLGAQTENAGNAKCDQLLVEVSKVTRLRSATPCARDSIPFRRDRLAGAAGFRVDENDGLIAQIGQINGCPVRRLKWYGRQMNSR